VELGPSCLGKHLNIHISFLDENHLDESHPSKDVGKKISTPSSFGEKNGLIVFAYYTTFVSFQKHGTPCIQVKQKQ
jgi:hypothetical protein